MPRTLTDKEQQAVSKKRQDPRPKFFNDASKNEEQISKTGEEWCILCPDKQKIITVLQEATQDTYERDARTALFAEFTDALVDALKKRGDEYLQDVQRIEDAERVLSPQQDTTQGTKMEGVDDTFEVKLMAADIQLSKDEIRRKHEEAVYEYEWLKFTVKARWAAEGVVDGARKKRMTSWQTVLGAY